MSEMALAELPDLPGDAEEFGSVWDGAPLNGSAAAPELPWDSSIAPDLEEGLTEQQRWRVEWAHDEMTGAAVLEHISPAGLHLIESFEGFSPTIYRDAVGVPTIGYGTTSADVWPLPHFLTRQGAENLLREKLTRKYEPAVRAVGVPLNQHQFDALVSFVYNLGPGAVGSSWTIGRLLRERRYRDAADAMLLYDHAGGIVLPGLQRRREAERALFLEPMPAAPDPHHFAWFPINTWTIEGHRIPERGTVEEFYRLLPRKANAERQLHELQADIVRLRKRIWAVAHWDHPPSWGVGHRGGRWQELLSLSRIHL